MRAILLTSTFRPHVFVANAAVFAQDNVANRRDDVFDGRAVVALVAVPEERGGPVPDVVRLRGTLEALAGA